VDDGEAADRVGAALGGDHLQPRVEVAGADLAQHRVGEPGAVVADDPPGEVDRRADGGVRRDVRREELVGAQPQDGQDLAVDRRQGAVDARVQDGVVGALAAQGAVGEFGGEGGVAAGQAPVAQQRG
jgi:hypothetical protein